MQSMVQWPRPQRRKATPERLETHINQWTTKKRRLVSEKYSKFVCQLLVSFILKKITNLINTPPRILLLAVIIFSFYKKYHFNQLHCHVSIVKYDRLKPKISSQQKKGHVLSLTTFFAGSRCYVRLDVLRQFKTD